MIGALTRWLALFACLTLLLWGSAAGHALADETTASGAEEPTPRECTGRFVAGPAVGIPLGLGTAAFGGILVYAGTNPLGDSFDSNRSGNNAPGAIAGGSILIGAGLAVFVYSAIKLRRNLEVRRSICGDGDRYQPLASKPNPHSRRVVFDGAGFRF